MSSAPHAREAEFAVYLVDPGPHPANVLGLLGEITGENLQTCALLVRQTPVLIALSQTEVGARDVVARLREFNAVAIIRPANEPMREGQEEDLAPDDPQRGYHWALLVLGVLQLAAAAWWWLGQGNPFAGVGGFLLGAAVIGWSIVRLRARE